MSDAEDLDAIADELHARPASEFSAARDARVAELRRDKETELAATVKAWRKPSASAEALNRLVRAHPETTSRLVALGDQLRAAQVGRSGDDLRALGRQRRELISAIVRALAQEGVGR
jgi:hypothetical protein